MMNQELKKRNKIHVRPITSLLIGLAFLSIVFLTMMLSSPKSSKPTHRLRNDLLKQEEQEMGSLDNYDSEMLAVVVRIDVQNREIALFDIDKKEIITLTYSGASDIKDKYGQVITASQIRIATMVDVGYIKGTLRLSRMQVSNNVWDYIEVGNLSIDRNARSMKIGTKLYKYTDDIIIMDGESLISIDDLQEQDVLTVRGHEETVWSVSIVKGHGTVKLTDTEGFQGGNVTVGYEAMQQITENMVITVREGNFNLTVENGKYSVTKNIDITRNEETVVSLQGLGQEPEKLSHITFDISPFGADLFVDGELISYAKSVEISYGEHEITVSLGGYTTYHGNLNVKEASQIVKVALPEASSKEEVDISVSGERNLPDRVGQENNTSEADYEEMDEEHFIYVQNPVEASVYLNGEYMGISPVGFEKIIGSHVITFIRDGFEVKSYTIEVEDDGLNTYLSMPDLEPAEE